MSDGREKGGGGGGGGRGSMHGLEEEGKKSTSKPS